MNKKRSVHVGSRHCTSLPGLLAASALMLLAAAAPSVATADEATAAPQRGALPVRVAQADSRGLTFTVLGCTLSVDLAATHRCLQSAVAREVSRTESKVRATLQAQIDALQDERRRLQSQLDAARKEIAKAEARAAAVRSQVERSPYFAKLDWQQEIMRQLQQQEPLFACLQQDPQYDFAQAAQRFASGPGTFAQAQLQAALQRSRANMATVLKPELDRLASGQPGSQDRALAFRSGVSRFGSMAQSLPGGSCVTRHVTPAIQSQVDSIAAETLPLLEQEMRAVLTQQIVPRVRQGVAAQLRPTFQQLVSSSSQRIPVRTRGLEDLVPQLKGLTLSEEEIKAIARGVLVERKFRAVFESSSPAIEQLVRLMARQDSAPEAIDAAKQQLARALAPTDDWDQLYTAIGVEMLRAVGHKYIDSDQPWHGGYLINSGVSLLQHGYGSVEKLASALCGLIPEVGAAACAAVEQGLNFAWNQILVSLLEAAGAGAIHGAFDGAMDRVRAELARGNTLDQIRTRLGPVDAFIASLPHDAALSAWAGGLLERDRVLLEQHLRAVQNLSTVAAGSRQVQ